MTDCHSKPTEQNDVINPKKIPLYDKSRVAVIHPLVFNTVIHPLVFKPKQPSHNTDYSHYGVSETASVKVNMEDLCLKDFLPENGPLATKLSHMLNQRNNRVISNWQHLAQALGVPPDVSMSFDCDSEHSPTDDLFDHLVTWKPDMTFDDLKKILRSAMRNDLIQILDKEGYNNQWKISANMDFVEMFKDRLDTPRRYMDWKALASKCGISKKVFNQFGKPKLGPTKQLFLHVRISHSFEDLTIEKLKTYFKDMDRYDILKVFEKYDDNAFVKDELKPESPIMYVLSELLDKDGGSVKNWKNLAYKLGIPDHIYEDFDVSRVNNRNPTKLLLDWIFTRDPNFTVGKFIKGLQGINRNDVVVELKKGVLQGMKDQILNHTTGSVQKPDVFVNECSEGYSSNLTQDTKLSHNWDHLSQQQRSVLQFTLVPQPLYKKVCQMLDTVEVFFRDFRMFAEELGMEKTEINYLGQKESPTHNILLKYKLNVEEFVRIMKSIGREDVVAEVETWLEVTSSS